MSRSFALATIVVALGMIVLLGNDILSDVRRRSAIADRVQTLPPFEITDVHGRGYELAERKRPTVLLFFRTTCPFCKIEIRDLLEHGQSLSKADLILISAENADTLRAFFRTHELGRLSTGTVASDSGGVIESYFGVRSIPAAFVYDSGGRLTERHVGLTPASTIVETLTKSSDG